jgi:hypothetical protein
MSKKIIAAVVIAGLAVLIGMQLRTANRADAAGGDCYSESKGPSEPTICN